MEKIRLALVHLPELIIIFFSPALAQIGIVMLAITADTITGLWASKKLGIPITSKKLSMFVPKCIMYFIFILLAHGLEVIFEIPHARTFIAVCLMALELMSIDENFKKSTGRGLFGPLIGMIKRKED